MKYKKTDTRKCCNIISSPFIIILISISLIGALTFTRDITLITRITVHWSSFHRANQYQLETQVEVSDSIINEKPAHETQSLRIEEDGIELPTNGCDLSKGRWVFDNVTRPLYKEDDCGFLTAQVTCIRNGREDTLYQNWRWQPSDCSLPKFKARLLLEKLRGKKLLFVGDSVNRNQWESMVCLLQSGIRPGRSTWKMGAPLSVFAMQDYNATVEFYWAPFLVESNSDDPRNHSISQRIIIPESISKHAVHWMDAHFLVFNTYIWWMNAQTMKVLRRGSFDEGPLEYDEVERCTAYERVLKTWANWIKSNVKPSHTSAFFISASPVHQQSSNWNNPNGVACALETTPILNTSSSVGLDMTGTDRRLLDVAKKVITTTATPVTVVDITTLSEYRKDAHTSVYTIRQGKLLTPEQKANPAAFADCLHWCLPGVPDTWNQLLYAHIISTAL